MPQSTGNGRLTNITLSANYTDNVTTFRVNNLSGIMVYIDLKAASTSLVFKVEFAHDPDTFMQETEVAVGGAVSALERTISAVGKYAIPVDFKANTNAMIKISAKGTGTADVVVGNFKG